MKKHCILIVEDMPALTLTYRLIFEADGWTAISAESKEDAIEAMSSVAFDVVFTDLNLQAHGDGLDVVGAASEQAHRPVTLVISGYVDAETEKWAYAKGADLVLAKPVQIPTLKAEIQRLLLHRKQRAAAA
jgi:DNA-binding NtrC family response regulator